MALTVNPGSDMAHITITVKVARRFMWRLWLGMALLRLAAWVMPIGCTVTREEA